MNIYLKLFFSSSSYIKPHTGEMSFQWQGTFISLKSSETLSYTNNDQLGL